jgi:hypothetical protein
MSRAFADSDHRLGGGHARTTLAHYLNQTAVPLVRSGAYDDETGRDLLSEVARLADVAGFMAFDSGLHGLAQHYLAQALWLAKAGKNHVLGAHILTDLSMQSAHLGRVNDAVGAADAAVEAAKRGTSPSTLARCYAINARAKAAAGDAAGADRALNEAERVLDRANHADEPAWIGFFKPRQLTVESMYVSLALGRASHVQRHAETAQLDQSSSDAMPRRDVLARATLAQSYLTPVSNIGAADVEHACLLIKGCIPMLGSLTSARATTAVEGVWQTLADFQAHACVRELNEVFAQARGSGS